MYDPVRCLRVGFVTGFVAIVASACASEAGTDARNATAAHVDSARLAAIAREADTLRRHFGVPGASLVIVADGRVVLSQGFGFRDVAARVPVTPQTRFVIGSCTKPFTALAAAISADQGLLALDDSPHRFLPYFHLRDPVADGQVTLRDLLSHRTGVPDDLGGGWFERYGTRENLIKAAMDRPAVGGFRASFNYNNYMFLAAGEALANANHATYEDVVRRDILEPLGMRSSGLSLADMESSGDFALGYEDSARTVVRPTRLFYNVAIAPAANINSTADDMGQWLRMLVSGGSVDGRPIVSEKSLRELLAPAVKTAGGHYALGWFVESWHGLTLYSHPGGVQGYGTRCEFLPDQRLGWVVLTNVDDQGLPKAIRESIYSHLFQ
jgi:CubicO group peptidase (beta-lactamase class C family)